MSPRVTVVGLGPGGPGLITEQARAEIDRVHDRYLRTRRHPSASEVRGATSFDSIYERSSSLETVYETIADLLTGYAAAYGEVLYAVPGSPFVAERTVELLRERPELDTVVHSALSFVDLAWARLDIDPLAEGTTLVDGRRFSAEAAGHTGPLLVGQCDTKAVLSEVKLAVDEPGDVRVTVLQRLGLPDEAVFEVAWEELDREVEPDHLTSLYIPRLAAPVAAELQRFAELVATLRRECPWDREQTHKTLTRHLLEETYETLEAIDRLEPESGEGYGDLEEELGDLLFQVFFHATLASEAGQFSVADVARGIHDKLRHRHPHVFADVRADSSDAVISNWEQIKREEKGRDSAMDGIPPALPALLQALKVQKRAAGSGMGYGSSGEALAEVERELAELVADPAGDELGDLLFAACGVAQHLGVDPEAALRSSAGRFQQRFRHLERRASEAGTPLPEADPTTLDQWWREAKADS